MNVRSYFFLIYGPWASEFLIFDKKIRFLVKNHMATCLNSLAETGAAHPMRGPYAHVFLFRAFLTLFRERQPPNGGCREPNLAQYDFTPVIIHFNNKDLGVGPYIFNTENV